MAMLPHATSCLTTLGPFPKIGPSEAAGCDGAANKRGTVRLHSHRPTGTRNRAEMATIKDVARRVGLSVTTVSRALNNYDDVAEATRVRVQEAARALDYHPNQVARSLQGSHTNTVALVIPLTLHRSYDAFWLDFIGGMAATCGQRGMDLLVSTADVHDEVGQGFQRLVRGHRVDGLVVCDVRQADPRIAYLQK